MLWTVMQGMNVIHHMQVSSKVSRTPQPEAIVEHQLEPLSTGHAVDNPMIVPSSTAHPNGTVAQPFTSSMLGAPTQPAAQLQPMEMISTTPK